MPTSKRHPLPRFEFKTRSIDKIPIPAQRTYYHDEKVHELALLITPAGAKSFYFIRWINGRTCFIKLANGTYPAMTPEQARAEAYRLNGEVAQGKNPALARHAHDQEPHLKRLFDDWLQQPKHARSVPQLEATWERYLKRWNGKRVSELTGQQITDWHRKVGEQHGPYAANAALRLLRALLNWAITTYKLGIDNPARGIQFFSEERRECWIGTEAMPRLLEAIEADPNPDMRDFFLLCLLTGARRGNVQAMRWDALDLRQATWTIPGAEHKNKRPVCIPLTKDALLLLQARWALHRPSPYVFPSHSASGHLQEPKTAWQRILKRAGLTGLRIHDLRHTSASWMVNQGTPLTVIGAALGHTQTSTTSRYAHLANDPVRQAMESSNAAMLATRNAPAEVITHPARRTS